MTEPNDRPPDKTPTRLETMAWGAAIVMVALLVVGAGVLIADGGSPAGRSIGLHLITMGVVMVIATGAAANHKAIVERTVRISQRQDVIEEKLDEISETLGRIMLAARRDEMAEYRNGHHR